MSKTLCVELNPATLVKLFPSENWINTNHRKGFYFPSIVKDYVGFCHKKAVDILAISDEKFEILHPGAGVGEKQAICYAMDFYCTLYELGTSLRVINGMSDASICINVTYEFAGTNYVLGDPYSSVTNAILEDGCAAYLEAVKRREVILSDLKKMEVEQLEALNNSLKDLMGTRFKLQTVPGKDHEQDPSS